VLRRPARLYRPVPRAMPRVLVAEAKPRRSTPPSVSRSAAAGREQRPRCVIVTEHVLLADLLAMTLAASPDLPLEVAAVASTVGDGIKACTKHQPGVVLLDLGLSDGPGIDVAEHVVARLPDTRVIVVSPRSAAAASPASHELSNGRVIHEAGSFNTLQGMLADVFQWARGGTGANGGSPGRRLATVLSRREREVLAMIGRRLSSRDIAETLKLSLHTVNAHRKNIARKLDVQGSNLILVAHDYREQLQRQP